MGMTRRYAFVLAAVFVAAIRVVAAAEPVGRLVDGDWLARNLGRDDVLLLDASATPVHAAGHIPGAVSVDLYAFGVLPAPRAAMEARIQSWGVDAGKKIVIYDAGGDMMATRLFFELYEHGVPATDLFILDGGLAKWRERGGSVTKERTPAPRRGTFRMPAETPDARTRLAEFLVASGEPERHALVEALEPSSYYGATKFFDRGGHVPNAIMWPASEFFNADKTFKPAAEIERMVRHLGITAQQRIHTYCGGGVAASVPYFALKFVLGYPHVKLYVGSQLEWLQDERGLPLWTYGAPYVVRDRAWLAGWNHRMLRAFGVARVSVIDVRSAEAYAQGHVPFAVNVPAKVFQEHLAEPTKLAALLGPAGVDAGHEAVILADGGLQPSAALVFAVLERLGQQRVSMLLDSMDEWGLAGLPLTRDPTRVGAPSGPQDTAVPPRVYAALPRAATTAPSAEPYPTIYFASGRQKPAKLPEGRVVHLPYTELLQRDGTPKAAHAIWKALTDAGVSRYAEIVCIADDPGEAAAGYVILRLMGFPKVKVVLT